MYQDKVLKVNIVRASKCALLLKGQRRCFDRITERLEKGEAVYYDTASFFSCAYSSSYVCSKENREYELHQQRVLPSASSPNVTFQQETVSS